MCCSVWLFMSPCCLCALHELCRVRVEAAYSPSSLATATISGDEFRAAGVTRPGSDRNYLLLPRGVGLWLRLTVHSKPSRPDLSSHPGGAPRERVFGMALQVSKRCTYKVLFLAATVLLLSLMWRRPVQLPNFRYLLQICPDKSSDYMMQLTYDTTNEHESPTDRSDQINELVNEMDVMMPKVTVTQMEATTCATKSKATLVNPKKLYCVGDLLHVRLDMYNYLGKRKTYGGDFLRARIHSPEVNASASGMISDFQNGTYLANFTLFWEGTVQVSVLLMHPSEAVSALWRARNEGYENILFTGKFTTATEEVDSKCGFELNENEELCDYGDHRDGEFFYCLKPPDLPCEAFTHLNSRNTNHTYLSDLETRALNRSNIGIEIPNSFEPIKVTKCRIPDRRVKEKCKVGTEFPFPGGYFLNNIWNPIPCEMTSFKSPKQIKDCLQGKKVFLIGDSTLRQFIKHFVETIQIMEYFSHNETEMQSWQKTLVAVNMEKNTMVQWKKHTVPFVSLTFYSVKEDTYAARQIDQIGGGENTIIILTMGQHFRPFPFHIFIRSAISVRLAIERLFYRSPLTTVIIKEENARDMEINQERFSDFHGYVQYHALRNIFRGLKVGFVDALDMTISSASNVIHPPLEVLENLISMSLTYAC
ncbi:NXPE family member 1-like [Ambystoma mexicanum]|uniref:NXPE family member 1-like n=1 Tax=Ambystoma mexicanum TaxID=8296 RepID=UPI0037E7831B